MLATRLAPLVLREAWHRPTTSALALIAVAAAVALVNLVLLLARAAEKETRLIQRDMGLNVLILPAATDLDRYWSLGYSEHSMPAEYMQRVADQEVANRLIPLLRRRILWRDMEVMLTGIAGEVFRAGTRMKPVFGMRIPSGTLVLGGSVARHLSLTVGDEVDLLGSSFRVDSILAEVGSEEDVRVYADLSEVQRLLDLPGRINEIQALECHCAEDVEDPLALLRSQLEPLLPGTRVVRRAQAAEARRRQRRLAENSLAVTVPAVLVLAGLLVGLLAATNVRERREEIGVLRALGYGSSWVAGLFLGRALLLGLGGAVIGTLGGSALATWLGPRIFLVSRTAIESDPWLLPAGLLLAPLFAALASLAPALLAIRQDPARMLRHE